jgi:hypothetical protein
MTIYAISWPEQPPNGRQVRRRVRLVIEDVPADVAAEEVLDWLDDHDPQLDSATIKANWSANQQLTAKDAPRVRWTGRSSQDVPSPHPGHTVDAVDALLAAHAHEQDFAAWLAGALASAAAQLGSSAALVDGRPGSWEAQLVTALVHATIGDHDLADFDLRSPTGAWHSELEDLDGRPTPDRCRPARDLVPSRRVSSQAGTPR